MVEATGMNEVTHRERREDMVLEGGDEHADY